MDFLFKNSTFWDIPSVGMLSAPANFVPNLSSALTNLQNNPSKKYGAWVDPIVT